MNNKIEKNTYWKHPLTWVALIGFGHWIYRYHFQHAMGMLPYIILLLCPLMHIFMHHDHDHGSHKEHCKHSHDERQNENGGHNAR